MTGVQTCALPILMVGALRLPIYEVRTNVEGTTAETAAVVTVPILVGAGLVFVLDRYTDDLEY